MIKKSFWEKFAVALFLLLLLSCKTKTTEVEPVPHWFDEYSSFNKKDYQQYFSREINALSSDFMLFGNAVKQFYQQRGYEPLWTLNGLQEHKIDTLFLFLSDSYTHGLPSSFFYHEELDSCINLLKNHKVHNSAETLYPALFHLEKQLTTSYIRYASALQFGATDPKLVNGDKWFNQIQTADSAFVVGLLHQWTALTPTLTAMASQDSAYLRLRQELLRLYPLKDSLFEPLEAKNLSLNQKDKMILLLCQRLQLTGELPQDFEHTDTLTEAVMAAVNLFRVNNAIPESPHLDVETVEKLNRPISYYIDKLSVNMERLRWKVLPQKGEDYIAVNLPDFSLSVFRQGAKVLTTNVCCGKSQDPKGDDERYKNGLIRPFKSETPLLASEITRIVLNPEWNIPYSILKDEYYPKLLKSNTAVINKEHLYVIQAKSKKNIIPDSIDWHKVNRRNIPYRLIQSSGKYNALGLVKFDFANSESVYLHDTNNKSAFKRRKRAISHGCVRVENPFDLAAIIYEMNEFDEQRIEELGIIVGNAPTTEDGEEFLKNKEEREEKYYQNLSAEKKHFYRKTRPTSIHLENTMPLYIEYYTCFVGDNDYIQYRDDVYYKDENINYLIKNQ